MKFVTIFGDLYQIKLWVICNNLNQFAHLSSASGPSNDVIKMAAIVLFMYIYKISYLKQYLRDNLLLEMIFRLYLTDWTSNNTKKMCSIFFRRLGSIWGSQIESCRKFVLKLIDFCSGLVNLGPFYKNMM